MDGRRIQGNYGPLLQVLLQEFVHSGIKQASSHKLVVYSRRWIQSNSTMQGEEWVILLSLLPYEPEDKLKEDIITALKPYAPLSPNDIQLTSRDDKYSAALRVPAVKGKAIEDLRELRVGETMANIRRYYHDHQLYINRVPRDISPKEVSKYFSNFGTVLNVVLVPSLKVNEKYMHCYIKFEQSKSVDKVLLVRKLELGGREIRALRTFRIGQSQSTDKRLEVMIEPIPESIQVLENHINQHFQALGELRQRVRLEVTDKRTCKGILAFTSKYRAAEILAEFDPKSISKGLYLASKIELKNWSQVEEGCRVFAGRMLRNAEEGKVRQIFETYGEISDLTLTPNKANSCLNAIITYSKMSSAKLLLAEYPFNEDIKRLFSGKPMIEFYLNPSERIHYNNYLNRGKQPQKNFNPVHINPNNAPFNPPTQFMPYPPMQGMMQPSFMSRPNYPNNYPPTNNYPPNYPNQK